jgi:hypothetical protein
VAKKSLDLVDRDLRIIQEVKIYGHKVVAERHGITRARVSQIVSKYQSELPDDGKRDLDVTELEGIKEQLVATFYGPDQPLFSTGSGKVILDPATCTCGTGVNGGRDYPHDENCDVRPFADFRVKIETVKAILLVHERIAKSTARDRPKASDKDESGLVEQALAHVRAMAAENRELLEKRKELEIRLEQLQNTLPEAEIVEN